MENINLDKIIKVDELDFNMILNVNEEIGEKLHRLIQGQATQEEKDNTSIQIIENPSNSLDLDESRKMLFKLNNQLHPMTILDFPCIVEANKTIDSKTFYKSSDISQMMYVHDSTIAKEEDLSQFNPFQANDETFNKMIWKKDLDHKYKLKHGLARCTRHIRTRRFKRKIRYNHEEILEVAKKLKSIIDNGAASFENQNKTNTEFEEDRKSIVSSNKKNNNRGEIGSVSSNIIIPTNGSNLNVNINVGSIANVSEPPINKPVSTKKKTKNKKDSNNNSNTSNVNQGNNANGVLNISLPLMPNMDQNVFNNNNNNNNTIQSSFQSDIFTNNNNLSQSTNILNPFSSNEKSELMEEYKRKKNEYKKMKRELVGLDDIPNDKLKMKKMLKKELKKMKAKFKELA